MKYERDPFPSIIYILLNLDQGALSKQSTKVVSPLDYWGKIACWYKNMTNTNIGHVVYDMMHPQNMENVT